jgi:outer membrane protein OmpA-like peptidoglycan-associated protein
MQRIGIVFASVNKILMNMKNIVKIIGLLFFVINLSAQSNSEQINKNVIKNVILINTSPWEVLMSKNGDILAKLQYLPDYLKGYDVDWKTDSNIEIKNKPVAKVELKKEKTPLVKEPKINNTPENSYKEIYFSTGSALLKSSQISQLNEIALKLTSNKNNIMKLYGFNSEPDYRSRILSKRRMDAVLAYLKIKGVNIDDQIIVGNTVNGQNNKIVFIKTK